MVVREEGGILNLGDFRGVLFYDVVMFESARHGLRRGEAPGIHGSFVRFESFSSHSLMCS